jgi:predicted phage terminase large subunit-like protein
LAYPDLKRAIREQAEAFSPQTILIEDRASGTQLIQDLTREGLHQIKRYSSSMDKIMRLNSVTSTIENGFVHLPEKAEWLAEYLHELSTFPNGKYDDQVDSTSQALDWIKKGATGHGLLDYWRELYEQQQARKDEGPNFRNFHEWKRW